MIDYYREHSKITQFGVYQPLIKNLPDTPEELMVIVQGLLVHQVDGALLKFKATPERCKEMELRTVESMMKRLLELNNQPLTKAREPVQRLISSCRDFAVFYCALLREKGIAARVRTGFVNYLFSGAKQDHLLTEYWSEEKSAWILADSRLTPLYQEKVKLAAHLNRHHITSDDFLFAGEVWLRCQAGEDEANDYATGLTKDFRGARYIQDKVIQDLASLNKMEMLPWDCWGYMIEDLPGVAPHLPEHISLINKVAEKTVDFTEEDSLQRLYNHPKLKIPNEILCASKILGVHQENVRDLLNE